MSYKDEIRAVLAHMDEQKDQESQDNTQTPPPQDIQDVYVLIVREHEEVAEDQAQIIDSIPTTAPDIEPSHAPATVSTPPDSFLSAYIFVGCSIFFILATLTFQLYTLFNPPIATITIIPKSEQVTLNGTLQLGSLLPPITLSLSQTAATTGHGHQDAKQATGYLTFYNGQFQSVTIAAGTILQGSSGIQIVTDQDVTIPAGNPPSYGQATASAHAVSPGSRGNIPSFDINQIYANAVLVKNTNLFYGGQDERNFPTVAKKDIDTTAATLKPTLRQSMSEALQEQLRNGEQLQLLPYTPTVTSDHQPGEEASQVKVTVSQTCSAVAYNSQELETKAKALLTTQALTKLGTGYSLIGNVQVSVKQASVASVPHPHVFVSFSTHGTWMYMLSYIAQQQIKSLLAGKTKQEALELLQSLPGIEHASLRWDGFGDDARVPKNSTNIHLQIAT